MSIALVSDLHLDPGDPAGLERLSRFADDLPDATRALWILGDLFAAWIGDDAEDAAACCVRDVLRRLADRGVRCHLMQGNRDFLLGEHFAGACGARLVDDPHVLDTGALRVLLTHGDALCTDDVAYQRVRTQLRDPATQAALLTRSREDRQALARAAREKSRTDGANKPSAIQDVTQDAVDAMLDETACELMVHGHTHRPAEHRWRTASGERRRVVLGDWQAPQVRWAWIEGDSLTLRRWR